MKYRLIDLSLGDLFKETPYKRKRGNLCKLTIPKPKTKY